MVVNNRQSPGFEFLNLDGVCPAEKEILQSILGSNVSKEYSKGLFCFDTPFSNDAEPDTNVPLEFGQGEGEDALTSESSGNGNISLTSQSSGADAAEVSAQPPNGTLMALPPHQHAIVSQQGPPPHAISAYYPGQPHMAVSVSAAGGPGPSMGPNSVHNTSTGNQVQMLFTQPHQQMMQTPAGYYSHHGYYGPPQPGGQTHMSYVNPGGESISPESNFIPSAGQIHQKSHHDPHHSMSHSPNPSGHGPSNSYNKKRRNNNNSLQNPQYFYTPGYYGSVPYFNQQLAQNVTGSPIIMAPNMYSYPAQPHPGMYNQGPPGNEMEHHPGNIGVPSQSMNPNEMVFAQQHHPGPNVYTHNSPTHSNPRMGLNTNLPIPANRVTGVSPQSDQPVTIDQPPEIVTGEKSISNVESSCPVPQNEIESSQLPNGSLVSCKELGKDNSSSAAENKDSHKVVKSPPLITPIFTVPPVVNGDVKASGTRNPDTTTGANVPPTEQSSNNSKSVSSMKETLSKTNSKDLKSVQRNQSAPDAENTKKPVPVKPLSVNGDIDSTIDDKLASKNRDKVSADYSDSSVSVVKRDHEKLNHAKASEVKDKSKGVNVNNNSSIRNVNASAISTSSGSVVDDHKKSEEKTSGEFPNLATAESSSEPSKPAPAASARGRSWASIASVKSSNVPNDGAIVRQVGTLHHNVSALEDQTPIGSSFPSLSSSGSKSTDRNVPTPYGEKTIGKDASIDYVFDSASLTDENDPVALRLGEHLQKYNLDHQSTPLAPRGLCNQSNYCFLNATLQALLSCPTFVNMFRAMSSILGRTPCRATPIIQSVYEFVTEFSPMIRGNANKKERIRDGFSVGPNLEPTGIRKCLGLLEGESFKVEGRQEDAEEFLSHLLNGLHDEMIKVIKWCENKKERIEKGPEPLPQPQTVVNGGSEENQEDGDEDQWQVMGAKNKSCLTRKTTITKSPISEAFLGQMCSSLSRVNALKSATLQPFYTLQLDIQNDNIRSVRDALEAISTREEVSGVTSATGSEVEAWRQLSLEELPPVLILHLKRFVYEKNGNRIHKIDKKLDFGVDLEIGKDLLSINSKNRFGLKQRQYKLFAVVYHDGEEAHKGHYVADCFHTSGGSMWGQWGWLRYDDTAVKPVPEAQMLNPVPPRVPYLLYYRRQDTIQQQQIKKERS